jgi:hypothetical protein
MRTLLKTPLLFLCALSVGATVANAAVSVAQLDSTTGVAGFTNWNVTPNAGDSTAWTNNLFVAFATNIKNYSQPENSYGGTALTASAALAQSFKAITSGSLTDIQIEVGGNPSGISVNLALYDAGPNPGAGASFVDTGSNTYTPGTNVGSNMLSAAAAGVVLPSYSTGGTTAAIFDFQMSGADSVSIVAGEEYIFEINTPSSGGTGDPIWFRMISPSPVVDNDPTGQAFRSHAPLNGNSQRDMSLAVTVAAVPEPGTLVLMGLAMPALAWAARRRSKIAA